MLAFVLFLATFCYGELADFGRYYPLQIEQIELDHRLGNRSQEAMGLGNLGVQYLGLGLYEKARSFIEQARMMNEALGAHFALPYDLLNLGEIYMITGDLLKARHLFEQALQENSPTQDARGKAAILNDLGRALLAMGDAPGASKRFAEAHELAVSQGVVVQACETATFLAASAVMQGQLEEARKYVHEAWDQLKENAWLAMENRGMVYRHCAETFDALGEEEYARAVIESGHQTLMEVANTINVPAWRQSFLEDVPDNRALMEMWERRK